MFPSSPDVSLDPWENKTNCFRRDHTLSVNCLITNLRTILPLVSRPTDVQHVFVSNYLAQFADFGRKMELQHYYTL